jgi:lysozyme
MALLAIVAVPLAIAPAAGARVALGVDVSRFNGTINWGQAATKGGVEFAFVGASRGSGEDCTVKPEFCGADPLYAVNYKRARKHGVRVGAYERAFIEGATIPAAKEDARAEADLFVATVSELHRKDLRPVLDVETPFMGVNPRRLRIWIRVWLRRVGDRLEAKPMIYTNTSSWQATGDTTEFAESGYRLWVADWNARSPSVPADDWAGRSWSIWQFTNDGDVKGIAGRVDRDRLRVGFRKVSVRRG